MVIAVLQFDLLIHGAESLKDKRRVVNSVRDRLHREHQVSVAEVGALQSHSVARMALALVTNDTRRAAQVLDGITHKLRSNLDAELGDTSREFFSSAGEEAAPADIKDRGDSSLNEELLRYADPNTSPETEDR